MSHDPIDDALDAQLDALLSSQAHVEDDGFSARVTSALPAPRRKLRLAVLSSTSLFGLGLVLSLPTTRDALASLHGLAFGPGPFPLVTMLALASLAAAAVWGALTS